jgi:hypothetical protein
VPVPVYARSRMFATDFAYHCPPRDKTTVFALARSDTRWSAMRDKFQIFLKQSL